LGSGCLGQAAPWPGSQQASAEASFADLAAMRLSQQSELVQNYLQLRVIDEQKRLLEATVEAYQRSLKMTENQYRAGVPARTRWLRRRPSSRAPRQPDRPDLAARPVRKRHCRADRSAPAEFSLAESNTSRHCRKCR
jgi:GTP cyclohydrolase FolE2